MSSGNHLVDIAEFLENLEKRAEKRDQDYREEYEE
jgi:hypothetical protein